MDAGGGGISLQIAEIDTKVVLEQFLVEARIKAVGNLDNTLNDERYSYLNVFGGIATPWYQSNPLKPISYAEGTIKVADMVLVYPINAADQAAVQLMPHSERAILYAGGFAIHGNLSMGGDMTLSTALDGITKRFLALTDASIFPMAPASAAISEIMPLALLNRSMVYKIHGVEG
jgi:hypothetical protein